MSTDTVASCFFGPFLPVKPHFPVHQLTDQVVIAGDSKNISLEAVGNPPEIDYDWKIPDLARPGHVAINKHVITIYEASRAEAGHYEVTASNSYGDFKTTVAVELQVLYPPRYSTCGGLPGNIGI